MNQNKNNFIDKSLYKNVVRNSCPFYIGLNVIILSTSHLYYYRHRTGNNQHHTLKKQDGIEIYCHLRHKYGLDYTTATTFVVVYSGYVHVDRGIESIKI